MTDLREELARALRPLTPDAATAWDADEEAGSILRVLSEWVEANTEELVEVGAVALDYQEGEPAEVTIRRARGRDHDDIARLTLSAFSSLLTSSGTGEQGEK